MKYYENIERCICPVLQTPLYSSLMSATNLSSIQTQAGFFTIAPFDHRDSLAEMLGVEEHTKIGDAVLTEVKILFMEAFSPLCSSVLVDPVYGFPSIEHKAKNTGLILTLEVSGTPSEAVPTLIPNWGVEDVKNNYGVAKLKMSYHPGEENAEKKKKLVTELHEYCHHEGVAFLLEVLMFNPFSKEELTMQAFQDAQLQMAHEFQQHCDVLKIQYPGDALACATMTAELDVPWILLSRGMVYDKFRDALHVAVENGCKGFAAGRALWQEIGSLRAPDGLPDFPKIQEFLNTTSVTRLKELISITTSTSK